MVDPLKYSYYLVLVTEKKKKYKHILTIIHNKQYYTFKDTHEFTRKSIVYFDVIFYFNQKIHTSLYKR